MKIKNERYELIKNNIDCDHALERQSLVILGTSPKTARISITS